MKIDKNAAAGTVLLHVNAVGCGLQLRAPGSFYLFSMRPLESTPTRHWLTESTLLKAAVIVLVSLWIYSPVSDADWHWDDDYLLTNNPAVQSPDGLPGLWIAPSTADYFPLTMSALWLLWKFFGPDPAGYHTVSTLLHALSGLMLWNLLHLMRQRGAWFAALLFTVHPLCVESVAWISELKNTISLPLFLAAASFWVLFREKHSKGTYLAALGFFLLSMLAKSSCVMFPVAILLYTWWRENRLTVRDIVASAPFFLVSLLLGLVTLHFQLERAIGDEPIPIGGIASRFAIAGTAILFYLSKIAWPHPLLPSYPQWDMNPPVAFDFLPWAVLIGGFVWLWTLRKTWGRDALMALGFFIVMLVPVLGFVPMSFMRISWVSDHFIHIPMIGIIAWIGAGAARLLEFHSDSSAQLLRVGAAIVAATLAVASHTYAGAWLNEDTLWTHTLKYNNDSWQAHNRLGAMKFNRGENSAALIHLREAVRLRPDLAETQNNLGSAVLAQKDTKNAIRHFMEARRLSPDIIAIQENLARALILDGRFTDARDIYAGLVEKYPDNPNFLCNLGVTVFRSGDANQAIRCFEKALQINPNLEDARTNLLHARQAINSPPGGAP